MKNLVSVLMPVFNGEKYLKEAIESILSQSYELFEFLIIDDGSTDSSLDIIRLYEDERIRVISNAENIGLIKTLNLGISLCKGDFIARFDCDDVSMPYRLNDQINYLKNNSKSVLVGGQAIRIDAQGNEIKKMNVPLSHKGICLGMVFGNKIFHPAAMIRKSSLPDFPYDIGWKHVEDFYLWLHLSEKGEFHNLNKVVLKYRWHSSNVSKLNFDEQMNNNAKIKEMFANKLGLKVGHDFLNKLNFGLNLTEFDLELMHKNIFSLLPEYYKNNDDVSKLYWRYHVNFSSLGFKTLKYYLSGNIKKQIFRTIFLSSLILFKKFKVIKWNRK
jgi:glycosyltransferase involved in cell wall biosynthesis